MPELIDRELTERQRAVLEGIDRRQPLKAIAGDLGISESRVNQHVKALKDAFGVNSLSDLVEAWRADETYEPSVSGDEHLSEACRKPAWRNPQVPDPAGSGENRPRVAPGEFVLSDAAPIAIEAPWLVKDEPRVVPGVLDGDNAVLLRLAVIIGLAFGMIAAVVLVVTASLSLSKVFEGRVVISEANSQPPG
ncbi:LuxR C-terminal-related transcriptional regulator [Tsuneonella mangrovi]|uniref:LuxR C-terminal-related transcriptional regulator n=1 Tax=Tsuneonella mangrovi TaxID=1982042 RepID=UPI000BA2A2B0|nr:LuxR C-terminal-related transcriptional regulator [Tsuneonella mangrovi]